MGRMQGSNSHIEYNYESIQFERERLKRNIHPVTHRCKYNEKGICKAPKFINCGLECRRPQVCNRYV